MKRVITYDETLYPKEVLIKAAYHFIDQAYIHLDKADGKYEVQIMDKEDNESITKEMFDEEMLIQAARYVVSEKTKDIRKLTLARAFASTLIDEEDLETDNADDRLEATEDILKDWFENGE